MDFVKNNEIDLEKAAASKLECAAIVLRGNEEFINSDILSANESAWVGPFIRAYPHLVNWKLIAVNSAEWAKNLAFDYPELVDREALATRRATWAEEFLASDFATCVPADLDASKIPAMVDAANDDVKMAVFRVDMVQKQSDAVAEKLRKARAALVRANQKLEELKQLSVGMATAMTTRNAPRQLQDDQDQTWYAPRQLQDDRGQTWYARSQT